MHVNCYIKSVRLYPELFFVCIAVIVSNTVNFVSLLTGFPEVLQQPGYTTWYYVAWFSVSIAGSAFSLYGLLKNNAMVTIYGLSTLALSLLPLCVHTIISADLVTGSITTAALAGITYRIVFMVRRSQARDRR